MSELPRRPFTPEMPPPEGLNSVRLEASRRRRVRAMRLTAGGAATAAAAAVVVAITGATGGADTLQPLPPAVRPTSGPVATATLSPPAVPPPITTNPGTVGNADRSGGPQPVVTATSGPEGEGAAVSTAQPAAEPRAQDSASSGSRGDEPRMTRYRSTYESPAGARLCGGGSSSDDSGFHNGVGWCPSVSAYRVSGGVRLTFQICRDATAGGRLTFASSREVDLVLRRDGRTVWSWAKVSASHPDSHLLTTPANGCWNWTLVWPGTTSDGKSAPRGTYSLTGASTAQEVSPDSAKTSFSY